MYRPHPHPYQNAAGWGLLAVAIFLLWGVSSSERPIYLELQQFVFFHTAIEILSIVVAFLVFITGYRAILSQRKGAVIILGVSFLGVGLLDFLHTMASIGMPEIALANSPEKSNFFRLAARLLGAMALLVYVALPDGPEVPVWKKRLAVGLMLAVVTTIGMVGVSAPDLSRLEIRWEWLLICLHMVTLVVLWKRRQTLVRECVMALGFAAIFSIASEIFFAMQGATDMANASVLGHAYKIVAFLFLFHATFNEALRRPIERMHAQYQREAATLSAAPDGVLWVDETGCIVMTNPAIEALTGYRSAELMGQHVNIFLPAHLRERHRQAMQDYFYAPHPRAMGQMDLNLVRSDGQRVHVDISLGHWEEEGSKHSIAYIRDLSERKQFEESLRHKATHDALTGLPNRWLFRLQLDQALTRAARSGQRVAVLFLDLDYFKNVNDSFGHDMGDALLIQVGARIHSMLREHDTLARQGGDEFAILLTDLAEVDEAIAVATKLLLSLQASFQLRQQDIYSGGSLGLAFYPDDASDSDTLLRYADMAMYQAKQAGRGAYACYSGEMDRRVHEDMQLHTRLKDALALGTLRLHYQPQVDVLRGVIVGAEALLRWNDPVLGEVSPSRFIAVAEATGLILPLSDWVLEAACRQIAAWSNAGSPLKVAVNFSAHQFRQRDLVQKVAATLERTGAQAPWLDIEITESVAMTQPEHAREQLDALVALGCSIALDDFGTGYSSLAYLKALPVSKLKIDQSFMRGIPQDVNDVTISRAIIALAHSLGLQLVAEGVETADQLDFLQKNGCEMYQGWLFAKALPAQALTGLLTKSGQSALHLPEKMQITPAHRQLLPAP